MIFWMSVPFTQIANSAHAIRPSRLGDGFVSSRHPLKQILEPFIPFSRWCCLFNEQMSTVYRAEQNTSGFIREFTSLNILMERSQRRF